MYQELESVTVAVAQAMQHQPTYDYGLSDTAFHEGAPMSVNPSQTVAWHARLVNGTQRIRTLLQAFSCRRDKPQQQSLSREVRHLLAWDDPLNDKFSADVLVRSGFLK